MLAVMFQRFTQYLASSNSNFQLSNFLDKTGVQGEQHRPVAQFTLHTCPVPVRPVHCGRSVRETGRGTGTSRDNESRSQAGGRAGPGVRWGVWGGVQAGGWGGVTGYCCALLIV